MGKRVRKIERGTPEATWSLDSLLEPAPRDGPVRCYAPPACLFVTDGQRRLKREAGGESQETNEGGVEIEVSACLGGGGMTQEVMRRGRGEVTGRSGVWREEEGQ